MPQPPATKLPDWFPAWARQLAQSYSAGTSCVFVIHGNVHDLIRVNAEGKDDSFCDLAEFLATQVFGAWDVVLHYDLGRGLRSLAAGDAARLASMNKALVPLWGEPAAWPNDPDRVLAQIDRLAERILVDAAPSAPAAGRIGCRSLAVVFDHAQFLAPPGDAQLLPPAAAARVVRLVGWSQNPYVKRANIAFCLVVDQLGELNNRLAQSSYVTTIEIPLPERGEREAYVRSTAKISDAGEIARLTDASAGLSLVNLRALLADALDDNGRLNDTAIRRVKKTLIERQCGDLVEFIEPRRTLADVVGHDAARARMSQDAAWLAAGRENLAPMGYLICGPVGTGKSYLAECYAGSVGIPCVKLRNLRSKYVGESEANLQRVLSVLRSLGPVVVIIDEADAALGSRRAEGDSGTSARVFAMLAAQMGDTAYRGKIVWMLLTSRPDLLPIDLKRQGRAEVHIPLFYPQSEGEIVPMFAAMAKKNGVSLADLALDAAKNVRDVSGADVESIILSARRQALAAGREAVGRDDLAAAVAAFLPSAHLLEKKYQEIAAVMECSDREFLPDAWGKRVENAESRAALGSELAQIRALLDT